MRGRPNQDGAAGRDDWLQLVAEKRRRRDGAVVEHPDDACEQLVVSCLHHSRENLEEAGKKGLKRRKNLIVDVCGDNVTRRLDCHRQHLDNSQLVNKLRTPDHSDHCSEHVKGRLAKCKS